MSEDLWHRHRVAVRFQDIDAAGIMFFAKVFELFHDAYVAALGARGVSLAAVLDERVWAAPITRSEARFRRPMRFGDELDVELRVEVGERELTVNYRVCSARDGSIEHATGSTTHAFVDRATFRRIEIPEAVQRALQIRS
ncbi:MAG: acyl-CoA thioesterase [Myxococcales bacterium]|nr:acyl-CoA thioesterase [Myxococcales bacterium]